MPRLRPYSASAIASWIYFQGRCGSYPYPRSFFTYNYIRGRVNQYFRIMRINPATANESNTSYLPAYLLNAMDKAYRDLRMIENIPYTPLRYLLTDFAAHPASDANWQDVKTLKVLACAWDDYQCCDDLYSRYRYLAHLLKRSDLPEDSPAFNALLMAMTTRPINAKTIGIAIDHLHTVIDDEQICLAVH